MHGINAVLLNNNKVKTYVMFVLLSLFILTIVLSVYFFDLRIVITPLVSLYSSDVKTEIGTLDGWTSG